VVVIFSIKEVIKMSKKQTKNNSGLKEVSTEELALMSDEELKAREEYLYEEIERRDRSGKDTTQFEVELCYVQREQDIRVKRDEMHQQFKTDEHESFAEWRKFISEVPEGNYRDGGRAFENKRPW
jgi:uncharacterized small protein (DUF1192 family)